MLNSLRIFCNCNQTLYQCMIRRITSRLGFTYCTTHVLSQIRGETYFWTLFSVLSESHETEHHELFCQSHYSFTIATAKAAKRYEEQTRKKTSVGQSNVDDEQGNQIYHLLMTILRCVYQFACTRCDDSVSTKFNEYRSVCIS